MLLTSSWKITNEYILERTATEKKILRNVWSKGDLCFRSGDILVIYNCHKVIRFGENHPFKDKDNHRWLHRSVMSLAICISKTEKETHSGDLKQINFDFHFHFLSK